MTKKEMIKWINDNFSRDDWGRTSALPEGWCFDDASSTEQIIRSLDWVIVIKKKELSIFSGKSEATKEIKMNKKQMVEWCNENLTGGDWGKPHLLPATWVFSSGYEGEVIVQHDDGEDVEGTEILRCDITTFDVNETQDIGVKNGSKYDRKITNSAGESIIVDVYDVLEAFVVTCPALSHLAKKALCAGLRGHKDKGQDLVDIVKSAGRAVELHKGRFGE